MLGPASAGPRRAASPAVAGSSCLVSTLDPANLYGAGAPLDVELLDGGSARLPRVAGNFLAIGDGRPVLIVESYGKRLTGLPWASPAAIDSALKLLPTLTGPGQRILKVELYNGDARGGEPDRRPAGRAGLRPRLSRDGLLRGLGGLGRRLALIVGPQARPGDPRPGDALGAQRWMTFVNQSPASSQPELRLHRHQRPAPRQRRLPGEAPRGVPDLGGRPLPRAGHQRRYLRRPELQAADQAPFRLPQGHPPQLRPRRLPAGLGAGQPRRPRRHHQPHRRRRYPG